ncbi:MAG: beta-ketoacyl-ACP synthase II [Planctomycetaceae bacterium]|jgi:3-oxoacyl-[acyl-carrier-protein] synthase II|nr:beta-ketoacyl-ACP synthase II [Planctomycetaceae bacterium]
MNRAVITGYGLVTPLGFRSEEVWESVCAGKSGIALSSAPNVAESKSKISGECRDFSTEGYISVRDTNRLERFVQYAMVAAVDAVNQSGIDFDKEDRDRCAVIIGNGIGGLVEFELQHTRLLEKGFSKVSPFAIPKQMPNSAASNVSIHFGLLGPSYAISTACASATNAMHDALRMIRYGEADIIIAGGSEAAATRLGLAGFGAMHALSTRNGEPEKASRPFDKDRDGFVVADGCGILVLESLEHAQKRGAVIFGEIRGTGLTSDGTHITQPDENGTGAAKAILKTLADAKVNPEEIGYINAHGTGTVLGDIAETRAVKTAFGNRAYKIPMSSTKSEIGHTLGGSGAVEAIFLLLTIRDGIIPPTLNLETPGDDCDLDYVPNIAREKKVAVALSNSFGFGGHNGCVIVSRFNG